LATFWGNNPDVFAIGSDQTDFRATDTIIDPWARVARRWRIVRFASYGFVPCVVLNSNIRTLSLAQQNIKQESAVLHAMIDEILCSSQIFGINRGHASCSIWTRN